LVLRLQPEVISQNWDIIKFAVHKSLPLLSSEAGEAEMTSILSRLISGVMQAWLIQDNPGQPVGICVTIIVEDYATRSKSLTIYAIFGGKPFSIANINELIKVLEEFAVASSCKRLIFYSDRDNVVKLGERFGFDTSTTLAVKEIQ